MKNKSIKLKDKINILHDLFTDVSRERSIISDVLIELLKGKTICPVCKGEGGEVDAVIIKHNKEYKHWSECYKCEGEGYLEKIIEETNK